MVENSTVTAENLYAMIRNYDRATIAMSYNESVCISVTMPTDIFTLTYNSKRETSVISGRIEQNNMPLSVILVGNVFEINEEEGRIYRKMKIYSDKMDIYFKILLVGKS